MLKGVVVLKITEQHKYRKSVVNSHIWINDSSVVSKLYIKKWRSPDPNISKIINVTFSTVEDFEEEINYSEEDIVNNPALLETPIISNFIYFREHTETIRFKPTSEYAPFESFYMPKYFLRKLGLKDITDNNLILQIKIR